MELFKIFGTIAVNNSEANSSIDETQSKASSLADKLSSGFTKTGETMTKVGNKLLPVTAAIGGIGVATGKMSMDFENAMAKVSTIADTSEVSIDDMKKAILNLSSETGIAATDIADNVYNAISAGQKTRDAVNFVSNATKLARAGFAESGDALDILTTIMNAYGLEAEKVTDVSDMLIQTQNLGKTTVAELSAVMGKVIPTAKMNGVQLDNLCGSYAVLTANGIKTAESTTYLNSMLNELGKQGTTAAKAFAAGTEHIKEGGLTMAEAMEQGWELSDVLSILDEEAAASGTSIKNMFGSAEAGTAAAVLWDNASQLNDAVDQMRGSAEATETAFGKLDTSSYKIEKSLNKLKNTGIELGDSIMTAAAPLIEQLAEGIEKLSSWFSSLDEDQKQAIIRIAMIVAALGPALIVMGKITSGIGSVIGVAGKLGSVISGAGSAISSLGGVLGALASPVGIIIAAIGALIAVFIYLWNTNEEFRNSVMKIWNDLKATFDEVGKAIVDMLNSMGFNFEDFGEVVSAIWKGFTELLGPVFLGIINNVVNHIKTALDIIIGVVKFFTSLFKGDWQGCWDAIKSILTAALKGLVMPIENILKVLKDMINVALGWFGTSISGVLTSIGTKISEKLQGFKDKIKQTIDHVKETVKNGIEKIKGFFNFKWSLPKLKMPHFSIDGKFSVNPPSVPKFNVEWYKKAMNNPMIMDSPTAFGINANGQIMAGGEAGSEVVSGTDTLMNMIASAVAAQNQHIEDVLSKILQLLTQYMPQFANMQVVMDSGVMVGQLAPGMDAALGRLAARSERGV